MCVYFDSLAGVHVALVHGRVVRTLDFTTVTPGSNPCSDHQLDLVLGCSLYLSYMYIIFFSTIMEVSESKFGKKDLPKFSLPKNGIFVQNGGIREDAYEVSLKCASQLWSFYLPFGHL